MKHDSADRDLDYEVVFVLILNEELVKIVILDLHTFWDEQTIVMGYGWNGVGRGGGLGVPEIKSKWWTGGAKSIENVWGQGVG